MAKKIQMNPTEALAKEIMKFLRKNGRRSLTRVLFDMFGYDETRAALDLLQEGRKILRVRGSAATIYVA